MASTATTLSDYSRTPGGQASSKNYASMIKDFCRPKVISVRLIERDVLLLERSSEKFANEFVRIAGDAKEHHKQYLETALRTVFWNDLNLGASFAESEWVIRVAIACVENDILDPAMPYVIFQEACDWGDGREKEQIANLFVDLKLKWRSQKFSSAACRNMLLRFAVELLSRLPKNSSTKARGRLLCYVSARVPMSDKGAANILGDFNTGRCCTTEGLTNGTATNAHQNEKFAHLCSLLDCLKNPQLVLTEKGFATFKTAFESIVELMIPTDMKEAEHEEGEHVEDGSRMRILTGGAHSDVRSPPGDPNLNNVRFIPDSTPGVLESDLKQSRVKRNVLCRFLFVAQYVCLPAKVKGAFDPTEDQVIWCEQNVQTALAILSRTVPSGPLYVERLLDHLESEAAMSIWKDNGCQPLPTLPKENFSLLSPVPPQNQLPYARVSRGPVGKERIVLRKSIRDLALSGPNKVTGSFEVTRILNRGPNTPEEFQQLGYQPPPLIFFAPVVEQAITGQKPKIVDDEKFQWRALRILGKRTHIHFSNEAEKMPTKDIGQFLENYIMQLADKNPELNAVKQAALASRAARETPPPAEVIDTEPLPVDNMDDILNSPEEAMVTEADAEPAAGHPMLNKDSILVIATQIGKDWERFAKILEFDDADSIAYWKSSSDDPVKQAAQMLQVWTDQHSEPGSDSNGALEKLLKALKNEYGLDLE